MPEGLPPSNSHSSVRDEHGMRLLLVFLFACGSAGVRVHYPTLPDQPTGTLVLLLSQSADDVTIAVNGNLVVDRAHTDRVIVDGRRTIVFG